MEGTDIASGNIHFDTDELKATTTSGKVMYKSKEEDSNWTLAQFHFHAPSEHYINNKSYGLEMHSVFTNDANTSQYLVVGIFFEEDTNESENEFITSLNVNTVTTSGQDYAITNVPLSNLYNSISGKSKYNYKGSLTTPTCDEAVEWFLVKDPIKINSAQLTTFTSHWAGNSSFAGGNGNNRVLVNLNRRQVVLTRSDNGTNGWRITGLLFIALTLFVTGILIIMIIRAFFLNKQLQGKSSKIMSEPQSSDGKTLKDQADDEESKLNIMQKGAKFEKSKDESSSKLPPIKAVNT
eukprot:CAMPEP_0205803114 /NCGR_PEP_ID=MMETSP0205-20121125/5657_1 /ASSEMBLY_ACC=CAM_ASM_000278 /TAXON_ID=36767 /ORGANISM="Euplotes focardii, Strain TN1" /LENGTH=293 /DNA_ID=CAMNT_0053070647 /DNA_START=79 /DNA_END=957 /DNA_ORIENTATION=-